MSVYPISRLFGFCVELSFSQSTGFSIVLDFSKAIKDLILIFPSLLNKIEKAKDLSDKTLKLSCETFQNKVSSPLAHISTKENCFSRHMYQSISSINSKKYIQIQLLNIFTLTQSWRTDLVFLNRHGQNIKVWRFFFFC